MRGTLPGRVGTALAVAVVLSGCGSQPPDTTQPVAQSLSLASPAPAAATPAATTTPTATTPTSGPAPTPSATPTAVTGPHFATPEAAMRYLAAAFDRRDLAALRWVTTPQSRRALFEMWPQQVHLRLSSCARDSDGTYTCSFPHDPPKGMKVPPGGVVATMVVAPAARPGWYLGDIETCG